MVADTNTDVMELTDVRQRSTHDILASAMIDGSRIAHCLKSFEDAGLTAVSRTKESSFGPQDLKS